MNKADLIRFSKLHKFFNPFYSGIGHVLVFHRVCKDNVSDLNKNLQVSPEYLESVLKYFISCDIDIVTLDECYNRITAERRMRRFVAFTFDDGYADNLTSALPVFEKYNAPFTLFLATGFPDHKIVLLWYLLERLVSENNKIKFNEAGINYFYNTVTSDEKRDAFYNIRRYLRQSNKDILSARLESVFCTFYPEIFDLTRELMLSWEQVITLSDHPLVTLGAHTVNHIILSGLAESEVTNEIVLSARTIEEKTGKPVKYLSYPFGGYREAGAREFKIAEKCNLKMAFTAINGNIFKSHECHLHSLPRISLNENWSISHLDLYINGLTPFINKFR